MIYQNITLTKENIKFITITTETSDVVTIYPDEIRDFNFNITNVEEILSKKSQSKFNIDLAISSFRNYKPINCTESVEPVSIYYVLSHKVKKIEILKNNGYYISISKRDETNRFYDADYYTKIMRDIPEIVDGKLYINITAINPIVNELYERED